MNDVEAAESNYFHAWRVLSVATDGGAVEETDDVLLTHIPLPVAYFNSAFVKPHASAQAVLPMAQSWFESRRVPFTLRWRDADGASPLMNAVVADIAAPVVDVERVTSATLDDHLHAVSQGFELPLELARSLFGVHDPDGDTYVAFNAYVDGEIASTATLVVSDDVAGIYNVATPPAFRRRGLGEAVTAAAVAEGGRRGCRIATLQASAMGLPIYERMGFRTVARWASSTP